MSHLWEDPEPAEDCRRSRIATAVTRALLEERRSPATLHRYARQLRRLMDEAYRESLICTEWQVDLEQREQKVGRRERRAHFTERGAVTAGITAALAWLTVGLGVAWMVAWGAMMLPANSLSSPLLAVGYVGAAPGWIACYIVSRAYAALRKELRRTDRARLSEDVSHSDGIEVADRSAA